MANITIENKSLSALCVQSQQKKVNKSSKLAQTSMDFVWQSLKFHISLFTLSINVIQLVGTSRKLFFLLQMRQVHNIFN